MSFKNAMQATQKSILQYAKQGQPYEVIAAVVTAMNKNTTITPKPKHVGIKPVIDVRYFTHEQSDNKAEFELQRRTTSPVYQLMRDDIRYEDKNYVFSDHARAAINAALPAVRRKLASEVAVLLSGMSERTGLSLTSCKTDSGLINTDGVFEIERAAKSKGIINPTIIGGSDVFHWDKILGGLHYDRLINDCYDADTEHVIAINHEAIRFIPYNRNAAILANDLQDIDSIFNIYQTQTGDNIDGVMADPLTGLLWCLNVCYDKVNYRWTFQWFIEWDIFKIPNQVYGLHFKIDSNA